MRVQIAAGGVKSDDAMARTKSEVKAKYKAPMSDALRKLANVFIPLIPAFIASGLITGIINILKRPDIVGDVAVHYPNLLGLMGIFGSAVFAIMNILVGVNTAKVFGGSQALGGVMAGSFPARNWRRLRSLARRFSRDGRRHRRPAGGSVNVLD